LDSSFAGAGGHLTGITTGERRLSASDLARYLVGVRHFAVVTVAKSDEPLHRALFSSKVVSTIGFRASQS